MRKLEVLVLAAAFCMPLLTLAAKITTDYDHMANFSKYKTYQLVKIGEHPGVDQLNDQRIQAAIDMQLGSKGMQKVDSNPSLMVGYQAAVTSQTQYTTFNNGLGPGWGWRSGTATTTASSIPIGTLVIDMMDPMQKQLIFRGSASGTLSDKPEKNVSKINDAVKKIFQKFPPKAKG